jgi:hypothetical protein
MLLFGRQGHYHYATPASASSLLPKMAKILGLARIAARAQQSLLNARGDRLALG